MTTLAIAGSLSAEQVREYETEGYLVLDGLLNEADMAPVRGAMAHKVDLIAEELLRDGLIEDALTGLPFETRLARLFDGLRDTDFLKYGRSWRDRFPGYYTFMMNPKILDAVESLIGGELFANPVYNVRPKVPRVAAGAVPWHQDKSYWPDANANPVITVDSIGGIEYGKRLPAHHPAHAPQAGARVSRRNLFGNRFHRNRPRSNPGRRAPRYSAADRRGQRHFVQRPPSALLDTQQFRYRTLEPRFTLSADGPGSDAGPRYRFRGAQPATSRKGGDTGRLVGGQDGARMMRA